MTRYPGSATPIKQFLIALLALVAGGGIQGCTPEPAEAPEPNNLQREIERLENEIGRLEFRVYQLEEAVLGHDSSLQEDPGRKTPADTTTGGHAKGTPDDTDEITRDRQNPEVPRGHYDLTPVE